MTYEERMAEALGEAARGVPHEQVDTAQVMATAYRALVTQIVYVVVVTAVIAVASFLLAQAGLILRAEVQNPPVVIVAPVVSIKLGPTQLTNDPSATFTLVADQPNATFVCRLDDGSYTPCVERVSYFKLADGTHSFAARAVDSHGNAGPTASWTWQVDTVPPVVTINSKPPGHSALNDGRFAFDSNKPKVSFKCSLDNLTSQSCISPAAYLKLSDGSHTFTVTGTDPYGNQGKAFWSWTIDTVPLKLQFNAFPQDPTRQQSARLEFVANKTDVTFQCSLDKSPLQTCASPITLEKLADSRHTFTVSGADLAGHTNQLAYSWTVKTVPPKVVLTKYPPNPDYSSSATFEFTVDDQTATIACSLDGGTPTLCSSPVTYPVGYGMHTFVVTATDQAGNVGRASYTWMAQPIL